MRHNSTGISEQVKRNIEAITEAIIMKMLQKRKLQPVNEVEEKIKSKFNLDDKLAKQYVNNTLDKLKNQKLLEHFPKGQYPMVVQKKEMIIHPNHENKNEMQHKDFFKLEEPVFAPANLYPVPLETERVAIPLQDDAQIVAKENINDLEFDKQYQLPTGQVEMNIYESENGHFFVGHQVIDTTSSNQQEVVIEQISPEFQSPEIAFEALDGFITKIEPELERDIENILEAEFEVIEEEIELS